MPAKLPISPGCFPIAFAASQPSVKEFCRRIADVLLTCYPLTPLSAAAREEFPGRASRVSRLRRAERTLVAYCSGRARLAASILLTQVGPELYAVNAVLRSPKISFRCAR